MERYVVPEVLKRKEDAAKGIPPSSTDVISWMVHDGRTPIENDPHVLTHLIGSIAAGGTYSTANFVSRVVSDLAAHPDVLEEIRTRYAGSTPPFSDAGTWAAFGSLDKLESIMKETSRLAPGSLLVYSRVLQDDAVLSNGLALKKGQFITVSGHNRSTDPEVFPDPDQYKGLRFYDADLTTHRAQPFRSLDSDILTWGAGRWACSGRLYRQHDSEGPCS